MKFNPKNLLNSNAAKVWRLRLERRLLITLAGTQQIFYSSANAENHESTLNDLLKTLSKIGAIEAKLEALGWRGQPINRSDYTRILGSDEHDPTDLSN